MRLYREYCAAAAAAAAAYNVPCHGRVSSAFGITFCRSDRRTESDGLDVPRMGSCWFAVAGHSWSKCCRAYGANLLSSKEDLRTDLWCYVAGRPLLNGRCTSLLMAPYLRNDLYCVEWDVKPWYTIPYPLCVERHHGFDCWVSDRSDLLNVPWHCEVFLYRHLKSLYCSFMHCE